MTPAMLLVAVAGLAFVGSCAGTRLLVTVLRRRQMFDIPHERSSHTVPVPRGGGIAVVGTVVVAWLALCAVGILPATDVVVALGGAGLAAVSLLDDRRGLSPSVRLLTQLLAVTAGIWVLPRGALFQGWLPPGLDVIVAALLWVWFINLFNFMDGIDGIAGSEAAAIGIGIVVVGVFGSYVYDPNRPLPPFVGIAGDLELVLPAAAVAAAALGFLVWNWAPARIFLGDAGSVPMGYLLGFLLCKLALRGHAGMIGAWQAALILPAYFLADATLTLLRRLARGERVWRAHREHFYQRAVQRGLGHAAVVRRVIAADAVLIGCAWIAENGWGFAGLAVAGITVVSLLVVLSGPVRRA